MEGIVEPQKAEDDAAKRGEVFREVIGEIVELSTGESGRPHCADRFVERRSVRCVSVDEE